MPGSRCERLGKAVRFAFIEAFRDRENQVYSLFRREHLRLMRVEHQGGKSRTGLTREGGEKRSS